MRKSGMRSPVGSEPPTKVPAHRFGGYLSQSVSQDGFLTLYTHTTFLFIYPPTARVLRVHSKAHNRTARRGAIVCSSTKHRPCLRSMQPLARTPESSLRASFLHPPTIPVWHPALVSQATPPQHPSVTSHLRVSIVHRGSARASVSYAARLRSAPLPRIIQAFGLVKRTPPSCRPPAVRPSQPPRPLSRPPAPPSSPSPRGCWGRRRRRHSRRRR